MKNVPIIEGIYAILAILGGVTRYLVGYLKGEQFKLRHLIAHLFISCFSGVMFAQLSSIMGLSGDFKAALAGLGGFMGTRAIELLIKKIDK